MSLNSFINTLQAIADTPEVETEPKKYPIEEYVTNAIACMMEGLPNDFSLAYVKYSKSVSESDANVINISYKYILKFGQEERDFDPADDLYPVGCINSIIEYYPSDNPSWNSFIIEFTPQSYEARYS